MKQLAIIVIVLCTFTASCDRKDTQPANLGRRTVEPWLAGVSEWQPCRRTLREGRVVEEAACGPAAASAAAECDLVFSTHEEAMAELATNQACLDAAIAKLEGIAIDIPNARSDLAALYYVRAQRDDEPIDLLRAFEASREAMTSRPPSPQLLFNRALILEALGLASDAITSWDALLAREKESAWTEEASQHRDRLLRQRSDDASKQWPLQRARLATALRANDPAAVERLIEDFPGSAQTYFEEEVLAQWGEDPSPKNLAAAKTLAVALSKRLGDDPFNLETVKAIETVATFPRERASLAAGHVVFRDARSSERLRSWAAAANLYRKADGLLAGSPLRLHAQLGYALNQSYKTDSTSDALRLLEPLESAVESAGFAHLLARLQTIRALLLSSGRHVEALTESERAVVNYERLHDEGNLLSLQSRRIGYLYIVGQKEKAWRHAIAHLRQIRRVVELKDRHLLLGEAAQTAEILGHSHTAFLYRNEAIEMIRQQLDATLPEDDPRVLHSRHNLMVALRARAETQLELGQTAAAVRDLNEAIALIDPVKEDPDNLRALRTRLSEVQGQAWMMSRPDLAITELTRALDYAAQDERPTLRARIRARRATAYDRVGRTEEAKRDLTAAVQMLQLEETATLKGRARGEHENLWSAYFSRSQATYRMLIRHLVEGGRAEEAFQYAERAKAFEPLNLILQLSTVPPLFRDLTANGESMRAPGIAKQLPPGTFLVQYSIHDDLTYAWILSRDDLQLATLPADAGEVAHWTDNLQHAARKQDENLFDSALEEPYATLISTPLAAIEKLPGGRDPGRRLVFIPDGAMHGLPIAALKNRKTGRHLLEDATVEIAGSATLYVFSLLRKAQLASAQEREPSALLIGDPAVDAQLSAAYDLRPLSGARREVARLLALYAPHTEVRTGEAATVPALLERAPRHSIVHIAAHAVANAKEPTRSTIFLAPSPGNTGALEAEELMKRLEPGRTTLVVLAACSSAGGVPVGPEGLAPLVRPFLTSGVPAVLGSLWDVNDATTEPLLVSFHRDYRQSSDAAVALQSAQRELLGKNKKAGRKSALAWAPFQVIGH